MEEAWASPFHGPVVSGTPENPAVALAVGAGAAVPDTIWPPIAPFPSSPDSVVPPGMVFGYTLLAAFVPMVPGMVLSGLAHWGDADPYDAMGATILGSMVTLASVPVTAMAAGTTSLPRTIAGAATGFVTGVLFGSAFASAIRSGEFWLAPIYSVTMAFFTTAIAAR